MRLVPLLAVLALAAPAFAQDGQDSTPKKEKRICRSTATTGSILGGKRECHTKAEWAKISEQARADRDNRDREMRMRGNGTGVLRDN